jgi:hypothetical protein
VPSTCETTRFSMLYIINTSEAKVCRCYPPALRRSSSTSAITYGALPLDAVVESGCCGAATTTEIRLFLYKCTGIIGEYRNSFGLAEPYNYVVEVGPNGSLCTGVFYCSEFRPHTGAISQNHNVPLTMRLE